MEHIGDPLNELELKQFTNKHQNHMFKSTLDTQELLYADTIVCSSALTMPHLTCTAKDSILCILLRSQELSPLS